MRIPKELETLGINESKVISCIYGGNSKVFKVWISNNKFRAYTLYLGDKARISKLYLREKAAIDFFNRNKINGVPQNSQFFPNLNINSYDWIDGVTADHNTESLEAIFYMLNQLNDLSQINPKFEEAVDYAFNLEDLLEQFPKKISKLELFPEQNKFLKELDKRIEKFKSMNVNNIRAFSKTLSLSDIGVHNMIKNGGTYTFIDFEFFGYDSTAKMIGDFILHPKCKFLSSEVRKMYRNLFNTPKIDTELKLITPILSLKWSLISASQIAKFQLGESSINIDVEQVKWTSYNYLKYFDYSLEEAGDLMSYSEFAKTLDSDF